jgi:nitrogen regulatory protein P-II 1
MPETEHDLSRLDGWNGEATDLWLVTAVIQPFKLDAVTLALEGLADFGGMTVTDCRGFGRATGGRGGSHDGQAASREHMPAAAPAATQMTDYSRKVRIDTAVAGHARAVAIARALARTAHTGRPGDGKVFVSRLDGVIGIRAFDTDQVAL